MISVWRKEFNYKFDGTIGTLKDTNSGITVQLNEEMTKNCNKSNKELDKVIQKYKDAQEYLRKWKYLGK